MNAISIAEHLRRGTYRHDRHSARAPVDPAPVPASPTLRRRAFGGLEPAARKTSAWLLSDFGDWHEASVVALAGGARSAARIEHLEGSGGNQAEIKREVQLCIGLLRVLGLEVR